MTTVAAVRSTLRLSLNGHSTEIQLESTFLYERSSVSLINTHTLKGDSVFHLLTPQMKQSIVDQLTKEALK